MAENKTKQTDQDVELFLNEIDDETRRQDAFRFLELLKDVTKWEPRLWGGSIVGFGERHYKYASGREGDTMIIGFSPRKQNFALYGLDLADQPELLLEKLGKHKTGKGCLYITRMDDVHLPTLRKLVRQAVKHSKQNAS